MSHLFIYLTVLAYLASMGLYLRFLSKGKELTGRLGYIIDVLGFSNPLRGIADACAGHAHGPLP